MAGNTAPSATIAALLEGGDKPLVIAVQDAALKGDLIMAPSITDEKCKIKAGKRVDHFRTKPGQSSLARDIKETTQKIRALTDCQNLQDELKKVIFGTQDELDKIKKFVPDQLEKLYPLIKVPLNPFKLPAYIVKQTIGKIMPEIKALIDLLKRIVEVLQALQELIQLAQEIKPRLKQCALDTLDEIEGEIKNIVEGEIKKLEKAITDAIAESICEGANSAGITLDDIATVMDGIKTIDSLIDTAKSLEAEVKSTIDSTIGTIGANQATVQELTGIAPVLDTSSQEAFFTSLASPEYEQWSTQVDALVLLPEPVISVAPEVTGSATVGGSLSCSNGTWTANGTVSNDFTYAHQWFREGNPIGGANTYTYTPEMADVEYQLYCVVTASNQTNIEQAESNRTDPVTVTSNSSTIPVISGIAGVNNILSCSTGSWPFTPTSILYEWTRHVPSVANTIVQPLSGNNSYKVQAADVGGYIYCKAVASSFRYTVGQTSATTSQVI